VSDEPGRGHALFDDLPPLTTVVGLALVGAAVAAVATVANPRGAPYVVATVLGGFAGAVTEDLFAGRYRTVDGAFGLPTAVRRGLVAVVVTTATTLTSLVVAVESGVPPATLPAVLVVCGLTWLGGVGLRRVLSPPVTLGRLRARVGRIDRPTWYVLGFAAVLFVAFAAFTSWLYTVFWMGGSDFGAYVHMFATTLDGEGLLLHGKYRVSQPRGSYWGGHFSLTLFAFLPLFALVPSPFTLLVAKSAVVAASVPLVWVLAREYVDDDVAGLVTVSYGLNPFLWSAWVFDFQEQALLPALVVGAFLAYRRDRRGTFIVLATLAFLTNEFAIIVFAGALVGCVVAAARAGDLRDRAPTLGATVGLAVLSFALAAAVTAQFSVEAGIPYASFADPFKPYLGTRTGVSELLATVAGDPWILAESFTIDLTRKLLYFIALFAGVVFLGLNDDVSVGAVVPYLGFAWFFAGRPIYHMFGAHYPFYLLPFIYAGTVRVLGRIDLPRPSRDLLRRLFVTIILVNVFASFAVGADHGVFPPPTDPQHNEVVEAAIEDVPEEASLLTQNDIYPHVATRPHATYVGRPDMFRMYQQAHGTVTPRYILLDGQAVARENDWSSPVEEAFGDRLGTEYGLYRCEDGVAVYRRGYDGDPRGITRPQPGRC
jgi:uncharacterized membrane protein